jgi:hypothetical protein
MHRSLLALLSILFSLAAQAFTLPGLPVEINNITVLYKYGEQADFSVQLTPIDQVKDLYLFIQPTGQDTIVRQIKIDPSGQIRHSLDLKQVPLRPFTTIQFWFRVLTQDNQQIESPRQTLDYFDNRFNWQTLKEAPFEVFWYGRDISFGQALLNNAKNGLISAQSYLEAAPPIPIRVYAYSSMQDLQSALQLGQQPWVAGHASPDLGVVMVSIPGGPEQSYELERQVPHELMHIIQYQYAGSGYNRLPVWLVEGLASINEIYPNPDYQRVLKRAAENDTLLPMSALCAQFPSDASSAYQAYAQSASFVRFVYQKFGATGLQALFVAYKNGQDCEAGTSTALNSTLNQLDYRWRQESLGINAQALALQKLAPYFLLFGLLVLIPITAVLLRLLKPFPKTRPV